MGAFFDQVETKGKHLENKFSNPIDIRRNAPKLSTKQADSLQALPGGAPGEL
jgi:hypothetical protein